MTDEQRRPDRRPTDEPDGTKAYAASLPTPGDSVTTSRDATTSDAPADVAPDDEVLADAGAYGTDDDGDPGTGEADRAGYDVDAVAGDTAVYRPE